MDFWEVVVRCFLLFVVVYFFGKQFILYRRFKKRGLYEKEQENPTLFVSMYKIRKGYKQAKKEFMNES